MGKYKATINNEPAKLISDIKDYLAHIQLRITRGGQAHFTDIKADILQDTIEAWQLLNILESGEVRHNTFAANTHTNQP